MASSFLDRLQAGEILVVDGATGTNLQSRGLQPGESPDDWVFDQPEEILRLHDDFIEAGADIILTDTFGATSIRLKDSRYADQVPELNRRAAELARQAAAASGALVAGSLGPVGGLLKPFGALEPAQVTAAYGEQASALSEAGVDFLLIETQFALEEALAALQGVQSASDLPVVVSFSYDKGVRTMMGVRPAQVIETFKPLGVAALGANCGKSLEFMEQIVKEMTAANSGLPIWAKPNAGMPIPGTFPAQYDTTPEQMGEVAVRLVQAGAQIVGGCCGTTPAHLRAIAQAVHSLSTQAG